MDIKKEITLKKWEKREAKAWMGRGNKMEELGERGAKKKWRWNGGDARNGSRRTWLVGEGRQERGRRREKNPERKAATIEIKEELKKRRKDRKKERKTRTRERERDNRSEKISEIGRKVEKKKKK